ncbi:MAG: 2-succinyl-6-hydroxy-2,4-cyclohexadiene-1-carboxylate synthase [Gemmatimonadaceae bacterium]
MTAAVTDTFPARGVTMSDGLRLEVLDSGDAAAPAGDTTPLLLLHGFTGAAATWIDLLPALAAHRRVVALSLPGHGASDSPADPARHAAARVAADVVAVMDALALQRVALLGYSMGGRVALHAALLLAATAPVRLAALVLESASPGIADAESRAARRAADDALAGEIERDGVAAFVARWERLPLWDSQERLPPSARRRLRMQRLSNDARGLADSLRGLGAGATPPLHDRLREIHAPTLLLCGALDEKYVAIAHEMASALQRVRAAVIHGAGHAVHLERPGEFVRAVNSFLGDMEEPE